MWRDIDNTPANAKAARGEVEVVNSPRGSCGGLMQQKI
jgi:hypothetical protein